MSSFEFVLVALAIILGFGISQILATWGEVLRRRRDSPVFFLQILASSHILGVSLRYLWGLWLFRSLDWNYGSFLLAAVPALVLALASHLIKLDPDRALEESPRQQYLQVHRPLGILLTLVPISLILQTFLNFSYFAGQDEVKEALGIPPAIRVVALVTVGYPKDPSPVEKERLPLKAILKYERWS